MRHKWLLDELSHAGPEHLDEAYVAGYERKAGYDPTEDVDKLLALGLSQESHVIEFGAGTGVFSAAVAAHCKIVTAVEPSPAMREHLLRMKETQGIENLIVAGDGFLTYGHSGPPVDYVFTRNALHHLPDFWKCQALVRMRSMLKPNGVLHILDLFYDFAPADAAATLDRWFATAVDDATIGWTADELAEHVREEYSTYSWLFEAMLAQAGFAVVEREYRRNIYGAYTCRSV